MINIGQFFNNRKRILNYPKLFKIRIKSTFAMKTLRIGVNYFKNIINSFTDWFRVAFFGATTKQQPLSVLSIFGSQYIIDTSFCLSAKVIPKLGEYLRLAFIMYFFMNLLLNKLWCYSY